MQKALLFINGVPPKKLPDTDGYSVIACSDGAFHYLTSNGFPLDQLDFISGDFDSHSGSDEMLYAEKFIYTPDQDKTDFYKSLEILNEKGIKEVDVYGGSGGEMDHFLGNLHTAFMFKNELKITFFDEHSKYFFAPKKIVLSDVEGLLVSLIPFPITSNVITQGLNWELSGEELSITSRIGSRNFAVQDTVEIRYGDGDLVVFVGRERYR
ncbi:thiamine diphosphokinase [Kaistella rhinocerotis]|uniref:thiamine diphosphokinase n=1 Tax=Kaistella rhinocerotis TaxID=3026437 RepID=UPI0025525796|nr:thiamine diphosphokinase [Kaistella sp. Ran72]